MNALLRGLNTNFFFQLSFASLLVRLLCVALSARKHNIILMTIKLQAFLSDAYPARWTNNSWALSIDGSCSSMILVWNYSLDSIWGMVGNLKMMPTLDWIVWGWEWYYLTGYLRISLKRPFKMREVCFMWDFSVIIIVFIFCIIDFEYI